MLQWIRQVRFVFVIVAVALYFGFLALPYFFVVLTALAAMYERRRIDSYVPLEGPPPELGEAASEANRAAEALGFRHYGPYRDWQYPRIRTDVWRSPDGRILVLIADGRLDPVPVRRVSLYSLDEGGGARITTNSGTETDLSGLLVTQLKWGADFPELLKAHLDWLAESEADVVPFPADDPLAGIGALRTRRVEALEARGLVGFLGPGRNDWRYKFRGAIALARAQRGETARRVREIRAERSR